MPSPALAHLPLTALLLTSSPATAAPPAAPADARGQLALYCRDECGELLLPAFAVRTRLPRVAARPTLVLQDVTDTWARPDAEALRQWGEGDVAGMEVAPQVVLVEWAAPTAEARARLAELLAAVQGATTWVEDVDTGRLLGAEPLAALAAAAAEAHPDVSRLVVVEVHEAGEGALLATRGMGRLGLPELVEVGVPADALDASAARLNAVAQAVLERGLAGSVAVDAAAFASPSAREAACALRGTATLEYARGHGALLGGEGQAELTAFDGAFGDCTTDPEVAAPPAAADPLAAARARAAARLAGPVQDAFRAGLPAGDRLMVKAPFQGEGGKVAWLWLGVEEWTADGRLVGPLLSKPPAGVPLAEGQRVQARLDLVFDYLWRKADGSSEGNETQALLGG